MAFDKLYADLVAPDGSVYVLYLATLDFLGCRLRFAELEAYPVEGQRHVYTARPSPAHRTTLDLDEPLDVELSTSSGRFRFQALQVNGGYAPPSPAKPGLEWSVCMGRTQARLELPLGLGGGVVSGTGYIDRLSVVRPSIHRSLRTLHWGRAHLASSSIVWTRLGFADGETWEQFARWALPGTEAEAGPLTRSEHVAVAQIEAAGGRVQSERVLHEGCALDCSRVPSAPVRWLLNAMAGQTHLQRWATRIVEAGYQTTGWGIHESVSFSR
jgi:hypothetical protein